MAALSVACRSSAFLACLWQKNSVLAGWFLSALIPFLFYLWLPGLLPENGSDKEEIFLTLVSGAVCLWLFRLTPNFVPAMLVTMLCVLLNVAPRETVMLGFSSDVLFLVLGMFLFAALISVSGLTRRVAIWLVLRLPDNRYTQPLLLFCIGTFLSGLIPSPLGRSAMMTPLAIDLSRLSDDPARQATLQVCALQGGFLLCTVFLTGNPLNFVMLGFLDPQVQFYFQWANWLKSTLVVGVVLISFFMLWLFWRCRSEQGISRDERDFLHTEYHKLGPLNNREIGAILSMTALILAILTMSVHHISLAWVTMFIALALFLFSGLDTEDMRRHVDWPTLIFIAAIVAWGPVIQHLQLDQIITQNLQWLGELFVDNPLTGFLALALVVFVIRLLFPGAPTFVILMSVLISVSEGTAISPWVLGFGLLLLSESFILPHQHGVSSQVESELTNAGMMTSQMRRTFLTSNIWFTLARIIALCVTLPYWISLALI